MQVAGAIAGHYRRRRVPDGRVGLRRLTLAFGLTAVCALAAGAIAPASANAASPLQWSSPVMVDNVTGEGSSSTIFGLSCIGSSPCFGIGDTGKVEITNDPADGATAVWTAARIDSANTMNGISCLSSPSLCVAVDDQGNVISTTDPTDGAGATWTVEKIDTGTDTATQGSNNTLDSVSCVPSPLLCVAVDDNDNVFTSTDPTAGASAVWTLAAVDTANPVNDLTSVSCTESPSLLCVAADNHGNVVTSTDPTGGVGDWTVDDVDGTNELKSVSCESTTLCVAVDGSGNELTSTDGAGATWTAQDIDGTTGLEAVDCQSTSLCVAVDGKGDAVTSVDPTSTPETWTKKTADTGKLGFPAFLYAVTCPSSTLCLVSDLFGNVITSTNPTAGTPAGSSATWTKELASTNNRIDGMSCPSTSLCVAVDGSGNSVTSTDPGDGATASWALDKGIDGTASLNGVSCPSTSLCVAVDGKGNVLTTTDPTDGAAAVWMSADIDAGNFPDGVSCVASPLLCVVVDEAGNVLTSTDPTGGAAAWSPADIDGTSTINGVSCLGSPLLCVAVDKDGNVLTSTNPTGGATAWSAPADVDGTTAINAVSCTPALCVATDSDGNVVTSTDPAGGAAAWSPPLSVYPANATTYSLNAVSCTPLLCVAVDEHGDAVASTKPTGGAWTVTGVDDNTSITGLSCPAATLCVAGDQYGDTVTGVAAQLTVNPAGSGSGTVTSLDGSITCPGTCASVYAPGAVVTLEAAAASGSIFTGWLGGGCSGTGNCTVTLSSDQAVTATFTGTHALTVALAGTGSGEVASADGSISCPGTCSSVYPAGTPITLKATPASGSTFAGWSGGGCSGTGTCVVPMDADQSVMATFTANPKLSVAVAGTGSGVVKSADETISCPADCSAEYAPGTVVSLSATPASGSTFTGWSGGGCSGTGACAVTMSSDRSVTASFSSTPPPPPSPKPPSCTLKPDGSRVSARVRLEHNNAALKRIAPTRTLTLTATCDQTVELTLTGNIRAVLKGTKGGKRPKPRTFKIHGLGAHASAGAPITLTVKLPAAALKPGARDSATLTLTATNANGSSTATARIAHLILV